MYFCYNEIITIIVWFEKSFKLKAIKKKNYFEEVNTY